MTVGVGLARAAPARSRWSWALAVVLVCAGFVLTLDAQRDAAATRRAFGRPMTVWVVRRDVPAGSTLGPRDVQQRELPIALVPASALGGGDEVRGRTVLAGLAPGEILLRHRLAGEAADGPAALVPPGDLGLALPAGIDRPAVSPGEPVVLLLTDDGTGRALVDAVVAGTDGPDGALLVGVPAADAVRVAAAARRGAVVVALRAPQGPAGVRPRTGSTG